VGNPQYSIKLFDEWGIDHSKIFLVVTENGANILSAVRTSLLVTST